MVVRCHLSVRAAGWLDRGFWGGVGGSGTRMEAGISTRRARRVDTEGRGEGGGVTSLERRGRRRDGEADGEDGEEGTWHQALGTREKKTKTERGDSERRSADGNARSSRMRAGRRRRGRLGRGRRDACPTSLGRGRRRMRSILRRFHECRITSAECLSWPSPSAQSPVPSLLPLPYAGPYVIWTWTWT